MKCNYASSGCNYPEAECAGMCMGDFEAHPRGTGEVLRQLRAEREALTFQVEDQRRLLERLMQRQQENYMANSQDIKDPEVVAWMRTGSSDGSPVVTEALLKRAPEYRSEYEEALITLQSHREAMKQLLEANASYAGRERWWNDRMFELEQRLAKKDAALQACVAALTLAKTIILFNQRPTGTVGAETIDAAIKQAEEARK